MLNGFYHVALNVSDCDRSKKFYTVTLGLKIIAETHRAARHSMKLDLQIPGGGQLELFSFPDPAARPSTLKACGLRHLAFRVADIDATIHALAAKGVAVETIRVDPNTGSRFTFFVDPDGLPIELYEVCQKTGADCQ